VSLSKEPAYSQLKNHYVCGYKNIMGEPYAGNSGTHTTRGNAVDTTNGAGGHNIQLFVMTADGVVLHCLPGYWNPHDLAAELQLGLKINDVYNNSTASHSDKVAQFSRLQLEHVRAHTSEMTGRSRLQSFDMRHEARNPRSDFVKDRSYIQGDHWGPDAYLAFRTTDEVMHQRMAQRPFKPYGNFDVAKFCDYGTTTYDKHEDSLDESGRMVAETAVFEPIKNRKTMSSLHGHAKRGPTPTVYVKTYGCVRSKCENRPQPQ
jgi:hypothetical protein